MVVTGCGGTGEEGEWVRFGLKWYSLNVNTHSL